MPQIMADHGIPIEDDDMPPLLDEAEAGPSTTLDEKVEKIPTEEPEVLVSRKKKGKRKNTAAQDEPMDIAAPRTKRKKPDGDLRRIPVPSNRYSPLKENWMKLFTPVVEHLNLQIRFNLKTRNVELRATKKTDDISSLQKGADFISAFLLGFSVEDSLALIRLDELFVESFEINDVKPLKGEHLSRAIGRIAGKDGRTKFTIENITKTRIVLADSKIHLLGSFQNIKVARNAICNLILGSPPSKVYGNLRRVAARAVESF